MSKKSNWQRLGMLPGPFVLLAVAAGLAWASAGEIESATNLLNLVALTVYERYVEPLDPRVLVKFGIKGLLTRLDGHTQYLEAASYRHLLRETQGEFTGIGVTLAVRDDTLCVSSVLPGSPAEKNDLRIGDRLVAIDTITLVGKTKEECLNFLLGEVGSRLSLRLWRPATACSINLTIVREAIKLDPVPWCEMVAPGVGYIRIARFSEGCSRKVKEAVHRFLALGMTGLVVDLRGNPGGLLVEAVETTALFLRQKQTIVTTKGRNGEERRFVSPTDGIYPNGRLVVVIDEQTASAAEILAGAIQDHDRGLVIGTVSYGKGSVQQIFPLPDESALKLTTARYYTPSGRCIQRESSLKDGLLADRQVKFLTDSGRVVFASGGIIPDLYVEPETLSTVVNEIIELGFVSDFIRRWKDQRPVTEDFAVTDSVYDAFIAYLNDCGYVYSNKTQKEWQQFLIANRLLARKTGTERSIEELSTRLKRRSALEFATAKPLIKQVLYEHFIKDCLGETAMIRLVWLKRCPQLSKAMEIAGAPAAYTALLTSR